MHGQRFPPSPSEPEGYGGPSSLQLAGLALRSFPFYAKGYEGSAAALVKAEAK